MSLWHTEFIYDLNKIYSLFNIWHKLIQITEIYYLYRIIYSDEFDKNDTN